MKTYLDKFYEGYNLEDIMETAYNQDFLEDEEEQKFLDDYEGDWNAVTLHTKSKFWRR